MATIPRDFSPWLGVFETLRVVDGKPLFFVEHRAELQRAMEALGLSSDFDLVAEAGKLPAKWGRWRWIVTRQQTETLFTEESPPSIEPVALTVSPVRVGSCNWDARFKTISYLSHAQAAKLAQGGEAVLLNELGHVASASRGNIFWVRGGKLYTPAHEAGCRRGVVRDFVLSVLTTINVKSEQGHFPLNELLGAEEIFLTNSMRGIVSANQIGDHVLGARPLADAMRELYASEVARMMQNRLPIKHW